MHHLSLYLIIRFQKPVWFVNKEAAERFVNGKNHMTITQIDSYVGSKNHQTALESEEAYRKIFASEDDLSDILPDLIEDDLERLDQTTPDHLDDK